MLTDRAGAERARGRPASPSPSLVVPTPRRVVGDLAAAACYGAPAAALRLLGVTGTQGKTTTTRLARGRRCRRRASRAP